ncbi:MAG: hypothetical protein IKP28_06625 [Clostridia bacterium]|nr:hypothetical protein [Clostridia bacterium]
MNEAEKKALYDSIQAEEKAKNTILELMQKFAESNDTVGLDQVNEVRVFLENLITSLNLTNQNIEILNKLLRDIENIKINLVTQEEDQPVVERKDYYSAPAHSEETPVFHEDKHHVDKIVEEPKEEVSSSGYAENTLIVSELKGKVFLPYKKVEIDKYLEYNPYNSIDNIIKEKYTLPITRFKNPFIARFREAFKLIRNKEKGSIKEAFDLGLELMFNYNLHPAIITACKNLDELDIYLDYLESGETRKFDIFKILFEMAPTVVKSKHEF